MLLASRKWSIERLAAYAIVLTTGTAAFMAISMTNASAQPRHHKHHGCKHSPKHGRCHRHKKPKQGGKEVHLAPQLKTGPFCDPHVFVNPDPAECEVRIEVGITEPAICSQEISANSTICPPIDDTINDIGPPCGYSLNEDCEEAAVPLEAKNMEIFLSEGFKAPPATYGCADIYGATEYGMHSDEFTIEFRARYGSFEPPVSGGKYEAAHYCGKYVPPCSENMPADGYDMAWVVVYDRTKHTSVESEQVVFSIEEPANVHHPVG